MTTRIALTADPIVSAGFVQAVDIALDVNSTSVDGNTTTLAVDYVRPGVDVEAVLLRAWNDSASEFPLEHFKVEATGLVYEDLVLEHRSEACELCGWRNEYAHIGKRVPVKGNEWLRLQTMVIRCTNPDCDERFGRDAHG